MSDTLSQQTREILDDTTFGFRRFRFRKNHRSTSEYDSDQSLFSSSDYSDSEHEDDFVWDVPNPFAPSDPSQARVHALVQAEIARMRRHEMNPLQSLPVDADDDDDWDESESEDTDDERDDADSEDEDSDADDADDEDSNDEDTSIIVLPQLFHTQPLRFITSPRPLHAHPSPSPPPPPSPSVPPTPWADLAQTYNDLAEAEERARKAKRDAHRSRLKALVVLGHEASSTI